MAQTVRIKSGTNRNKEVMLKAIHFYKLCNIKIIMKSARLRDIGYFLLIYFEMIISFI